MIRDLINIFCTEATPRTRPIPLRIEAGTWVLPKGFLLYEGRSGGNFHRYLAMLAFVALHRERFAPLLGIQQRPLELILQESTSGLCYIPIFDLMLIVFIEPIFTPMSRTCLSLIFHIYPQAIEPFPSAHTIGASW
ncbi:MAG: hypothetical protein KTR25_02725 [Myxococcales bacterium]|nr:hypothetical protein [Myxococcales bacterium]